MFRLSASELLKARESESSIFSTTGAKSRVNFLMYSIVCDYFSDGSVFIIIKFINKVHRILIIMLINQTSFLNNI